MSLVAAAGIEPASLDYQSSALPLGYTANEMAVAEGLEPSYGRINNAVPYQLGYATKKFGGCGWNRTTNLALMRRMLCPFELHSPVEIGSPRGS